MCDTKPVCGESTLYIRRNEILMAYTSINFKSKKDLKQAITDGKKVTCFQPGLGPDLSNYTGQVTLEGPRYPEPHKWYARATLENGAITKVK